MNDKHLPGEVRTAVAAAWQPEAAATSLERWLSMCKREGWGNCPDNLALLAQLFGASWYFTRLVFFRGPEVARYCDGPAFTVATTSALLGELTAVDAGGDLEERFDRLRLAKNELMLRMFLSWLQKGLDQERLEQALTCLAEASLQRAMGLLWQEDDPSVQEIAVLAMGRMAGGEMNFGSDLDLIFLYAEKTGADPGALARQIRLLLRHIALPAPSGILYEIDMRLRPHGTSGTLISPARYFIEYHSGAREVWERQMLTRCRPVVDRKALAAQALTAITPSLYARHDPEHLRREILQMRNKVQDELGSPKGKYELKRGPGGIMDIDFLTHYLQLVHGHERTELRTASTRTALRRLADAGIVTGDTARELLAAYDFLKRLEGVLRVADLKNVSAFPVDTDDRGNQRLCRAMGFMDSDRNTAVEKFLRRYQDLAGAVRKHFVALVGEVESNPEAGC